MPNHNHKCHPELVLHQQLSEADTKLPCAVASLCGGCPEFESSPARQRAGKSQALLAALAARGITFASDIGWLAGKTNAYRNRIRLAIHDGVPCYFNRHKERSCAVLEPTVLRALSAFEAWAAQHQTSLVHYCVAEVRAFDADGKGAVYLRHTQRNGLALPPPDWTWIDDFDNVMVAVEGGPLRSQRYFVAENVYTRVPVGGFMQVNDSANRLMVQCVVDWARRVEARRVLDLYAGSGNFALPLAHTGCHVLAIESDAAACRAFERAAAEQSLSHVSVIAGDAMSHVARLAGDGETFGLVIADPPRAGLRGNVTALCALAQTAVVLVSCHAERFCYDARALYDHGMVLRDCVGVDMFPHTRHMEVLGLFTPSGAKG